MAAKEWGLDWKGQSLRGLVWQPQGEVKGIVSTVHGLGEHIGRYDHVAEYLSSHGYAFLGVDLLGHGRSPGARGHVGKYEHIMEQIDTLLYRVSNMFSDAFLFVYGHSMGGNIVLNYLARRQPELAGAVVTSPWLQLTRPVPRAAVALMQLMARVKPELARPNGLASALLSRDERVAVDYEADPLVHNLITVQTFVELTKAAEWVMANPDSIRTPLLLMHGSADNITDPTASRRLAQRIGQSCTFRLWEGSYHELHNELDKGLVLDTIRQWLDSRCGG